MDISIVVLASRADPALRALIRHMVRPGSVMVSLPPDGSYRWIYFEGGVSTRPDASHMPSEEEMTEYALLAAGRAREQYPTIARVRVPDLDSQFEEVGSVSEEGIVTFNHAARLCYYQPTPLQFDLVYEASGQECGTMTGGRRRCACSGFRYAVRWPDGAITYPCERLLRLRADGGWQISKGKS